METRLKRRVFGLAAIAVIAVIAAFWGLGRWRAASRSDIFISGNIELTEVDIAFKAPGRLVELAVAEGQTVTKGTVVARLDPEQVRFQRDRERAALAVAQSQIAQTATAVEYQEESLAAETALRRAELKQAEARLKELETGSRPQEVESARAAVEQAATEAERTRKDWERAQTLYKNDDISTQQFDQFRARHTAAAAALKQAREHLALVEEGPRREVIEAARAQVERAGAAVRLAEAARLELKRRRQETETRRADAERARAQLGVLESQLADTVAATPIDGVVLSKSAEPGQVVAAGTTIVTIGDIARPWVRGYINETDLGRVKLGAKVKVTTDSYPGKVYWGNVSFIASEAEFTPKQIQTPDERVKLVYRVKIDIPNPNQELKSNMPVDAEIVLNGQ